MAQKLICDACGEPIDQSVPYFQITATKIRLDNIQDPSLINLFVTEQVPQQFDYHDGHQPPIRDFLGEQEPEPEPEPEPDDKPGQGPPIEPPGQS